MELRKIQNAKHCRFKDLAKHFVLFLLSFLLFLILGEIAVRAYLRRHTSYDIEMTRYALELKEDSENPRIGHVHRPHTVRRLMNVDIRINSDGFRDQEYPAAKDPGKKRIIFLGDSLTLGWGVGQTETFEALLERQFNETLPTEIINFGTGNYNTEQEAGLFLEKGLKYRPDQVVLFYFINDAERTPQKSQWEFLGHSRLISFYWSRFRAFISKQKASAKYDAYYRNLYEPNQKGWVHAQKALLQLREACLENHIRLQVVILPELHNLVSYPFKKEHTVILEFLRQHSIEALDLALYFQNEKDPKALWVAGDDAHPNAKAHRLIAQHAFHFIHNGGAA